MLKPLKFLSSSLLVSALLASPAAAAEDMVEETIRNSFKVHATLAQLHRWFLYYEEPAYGLDNQLDILAEDVTVASTLGIAKGHQDYAARVAQLPTSWRNAHDVKSTSVGLNEDGSIDLAVTITYTNVGMSQDGAIVEADLSYNTRLVQGETLLPKFASIEISRNSAGTAEEFTDAYGANRMRSLAHYWLALIEDPDRKPDPLREILAPEFSLNFPSGAITDFEAFKSWLAGPASSVAASTHDIVAFSHTTLGDNQYEVTMDLDWNGILPNGGQLTAKTRHVWRVIDDPSARFARIQAIEVEILEPFQPKS